MLLGPSKLQLAIAAMCLVFVSGTVSESLASSIRLRARYMQHMLKRKGEEPRQGEMYQGLPMDVEFDSSTEKGREQLRTAMERSPHVNSLIQLSQQLVTSHQKVRNALFATSNGLLKLKDMQPIEDGDDLLFELKIFETQYVGWDPGLDKRFWAGWNVSLVRRKKNAETPSEDKVEWLFSIPGAWEVLAAGANLSGELSEKETLRLLSLERSPAEPANSGPIEANYRTIPIVSLDKASLKFLGSISEVDKKISVSSDLRTEVAGYKGWLRIVDGGRDPLHKDFLESKAQVPNFDATTTNLHGSDHALRILKLPESARVLAALKNRAKSENEGLVIHLGPGNESFRKVQFILWKLGGEKSDPDSVATTRKASPVMNFNEYEKIGLPWLEGHNFAGKASEVLKGFN